MKILVLASQKGGAGKTTLAAHLAVAASSKNIGPVVLLDTDPQGSLSAWWNSREESEPALASTKLGELEAKLMALDEAGFALAVIDTPPAITSAIKEVVKLADLVLIPTRPSPHDLRAVGSTVDIAIENSRPFAFVVTQAKSNAKLTVQAMAALSEHGPVAKAIVHDRVDFASSMVDGRTVMEIAPKSKSSDEVWNLLDFVLARILPSKKENKKEKKKAKEVF
jgi:chromosome partitioning protein